MNAVTILEVTESDIEFYLGEMNFENEIKITQHDIDSVAEDVLSILCGPDIYFFWEDYADAMTQAVSQMIKSKRYDGSL